MTRVGRRPVPPGQLPYTLFRRAAVPTLAAAAVCVAVASGLWGWAATWGSLFGVAVVVGFYLTDLLTLRLVERLDGYALMPIMLTEYMIKVIFLAMLFAVLWETTVLDMRAMALTVACATIVWTIALATFAARADTFFVDVSAHRSSEEL